MNEKPGLEPGFFLVSTVTAMTARFDVLFITDKTKKLALGQKANLGG